MENYHVIELVGEGSFGKVYKGRRKYSGKIVALKFILKHGKTEKDIKSLRQEIEILRTLHHENVIRMLDSFETKTDFVVVTEFAQGELFEILSDDSKLPENVVQSIAKQLIQALHYLHSHRVIHRDMKPQNILIASGGVIKLCDFGFARALSTQTMVLTSIKGTPLYMAPELVQEQPYTYAVDLWSVGVILYELYVGQPPFFTSNIYSLIHHIVRDPVKYPSTMSMKFKSLLQGLLTKDPRRRLGWPALLDHPFIREDKPVLPLVPQLDGLSLVGKPGDVRQNGSSGQKVVSNESLGLGGRSSAKKPGQPEQSGQTSKRLLDRILPGSRDVTPSQQRRQQGRHAGGATRAPEAAPTRNRPQLQEGDAQPAEDSTPRAEARQKPLSRFAQLKQGSRPRSRSPAQVKAHDQAKLEGGSTDTIPAFRQPPKLAPNLDSKLNGPLQRFVTPSKSRPSSGSTSSASAATNTPENRHHQSTRLRQDAKGGAAISGSKVAETASPHPTTSGCKRDSRMLEEDSKENSSYPHNYKMAEAVNGRHSSSEEDERRNSHSQASSRNISADAHPQKETGSSTMLGRMLRNAGARATSRQSAEALLCDSKFLSLVLDALRRPASGTIYTQWASGTDLLVAARVGANILKFCHTTKESGLLLRSILAAAQACLAIQPKTTASIAEALSTAECEAAGLVESFVTFGDTSSLYADLVGQRGKQWETRMAGCQGLAGAFGRAHAVLSFQPPPSPSIVATARAVVDLGTRGSAFVPRLCRCLEDSLAAAEITGSVEATQVALQCLCSLVHVPCPTSKRSNALSHAPLTVVYSTGPQDHWPALPSHSSLLEAVRVQVAESLLGYRELLKGIKDVCILRESLRLPALQVLLASAQTSVVFCEAAAMTGLPQGLLQLVSQDSQPLALTVVSALAQGLAGKHAQPLNRPAIHAFLAPQPLQQAYLQLATLIQGSRDSLTISASAASIVALCSLRAQASGMQSPEPAAVSLPTCLYDTQTLKAILKVLESKPSEGPPAWESTLGANCRAGLLDGPLAVCALLIAQDGRSDAYRAAVTVGLPDAVLTLLQVIGGTPNVAGNVQEIHPQGLLSLLESLSGKSENMNVAASILLRTGILPGFAKLLGGNHLKRLAAWGTPAGGGGNGICNLVLAITGLVLTPYSVADINMAVLLQITKAVGKSGFVGQLVRSLEFVQHDLMGQALHLLSRLVNVDPQQFIPQFQEAGGLQQASLERLLRPENSLDALAGGISVISLIARHHGSNYGPLAAADVCSKLKDLLQHSEAGVRSRTCNLIGNLCRHLPTFYPALQKHRLLPILISNCEDKDVNTRKFACFAIGNAAFYNDSLYEALRSSCGPLVKLILHDEEDKTRANAAGAIGNLVRSSGVLCDSLIAANAPQALLQLAATPLGARGGAPVSDEPMKVALFSLGNMCTHSACAQALMKLGLVEKLRRLSSSPDAQVQKHCARIQSKLQVWLDGPRNR